MGIIFFRRMQDFLLSLTDQGIFFLVFLSEIMESLIEKNYFKFNLDLLLEITLCI